MDGDLLCEVFSFLILIRTMWVCYQVNCLIVPGVSSNFINLLVTSQSDFTPDAQLIFPSLIQNAFFLYMPPFSPRCLYLKALFLWDRFCLTQLCSSRLGRCWILMVMKTHGNCQSSFFTIAKEVAGVKIFFPFHILMKKSKHLSNLLPLLYLYLIINLRKHVS